MGLESAEHTPNFSVLLHGIYMYSLGSHVSHTLSIMYSINPVYIGQLTNGILHPELRTCTYIQSNTILGRWVDLLSWLMDGLEVGIILNEGSRDVENMYTIPVLPSWGKEGWREGGGMEGGREGWREEGGREEGWREGGGMEGGREGWREEGGREEGWREGGRKKVW